MSQHSIKWHLTKAVVLDDLNTVKNLVALHGLPSEGYALLLDAVKFNRTEIVKFLIDEGVNVNYIESDTGISLPLAVINGDILRVQTLLEIDALNVEKETPLHAAVERGNEDIVRLLLNKSALISPDRSNFEPLHIACFKQSANIVRLLLNGRSQLESADPQSLVIALLIASHNGNEEIVSLLLNAGAQPNIILESLNHHRLPITVSHGSFPLHLACIGGHLTVVKLLVESGKVEVNCLRLGDEFTPLHVACEQGHTDVVCYLLSKDANVSIEAKGGLTPLDLAAQKGYLEVVELLCKNGVRVDAQTCDSNTPLLLAAKNGCTEVVKMLLHRGAFVNTKDKDKKTPLHFAVESGSSSLSSCILQFQPDINEKTYDFIESAVYWSDEYNAAVDNVAVCMITTKQKGINDFPMAAAVRKGYRQILEVLLANGIGPNHHYLLHPAVQSGHFEIIQFLLQSGCPVNLEDEYGNIPIQYMFCHDKRNKYLDIFQLLVSNGADITVPKLLCKAVSRGCVEACRYLIDNGIDVNLGGKRAPLHYTVYKARNEPNGVTRREIVRLLLNNGADVNLRSNHGETALHFAARNGFLEVVLALVEFGADVNSKTKNLCTPLHEAADLGHDDIVQVLLKNRAEVDAADSIDLRPLHLSARYRRAGVMKLLLQYHADTNVHDYRGKTPLHMVLDHLDELDDSFEPRHLQVISALLENGCDVNIENDAGRLALDVDHGILDQCDEFRDIVVGHIIKLKAAGLFIRKRINRLHGSYLPYERFNLVKEECDEEVKRMKKLALCCHLTLHDALVNPSHPAFIMNESVVFSYKSIDWNEFPIYRNLIRNKFKKNEETIACKNWLSVLIKTRSVLHQETVPYLPLEILLEIVSYLDKSDLPHLIECGQALKRQLCTRQ